MYLSAYLCGDVQFNLSVNKKNDNICVRISMLHVRFDLFTFSSLYIYKGLGERNQHHHHHPNYLNNLKIVIILYVMLYKLTFGLLHV